MFSYCSVSLLNESTKKSIKGKIPKQPPNVATYTTGTQGAVPNITRCAPINPNGKGKAKSAETNFFLFFSFFESSFFTIESLTPAFTSKKSVSPCVNFGIPDKSKYCVFTTDLDDAQSVEKSANKKKKIDFLVFNFIKNKKGDVEKHPPLKFISNYFAALKRFVTSSQFTTLQKAAM